MNGAPLLRVLPLDAGILHSLDVPLEDGVLSSPPDGKGPT